MPFVLNQLVVVKSRTGPNQNKQGGVARISGCSLAEGLFDVKYVIGGGYEKHVCQRFIQAYTQLQPRQKKPPSRLIAEESDDESSTKQGAPPVCKRTYGLSLDKPKPKPMPKPMPEPQIVASSKLCRHAMSHPALSRPAMPFPVCSRPAFIIDQLVSVSSRTGPGENNPGGVGRITKVSKTVSDGGHSTFAFDVKYVIGGSEKNVAAVHIAAHNPLISFASRSPKVSEALKAPQTPKTALERGHTKPSAKSSKSRKASLKSSKATKPNKASTKSSTSLPFVKKIKKVVVKKGQARMKAAHQTAGAVKKSQTPSRQHRVLVAQSANESFSPCGVSIRTSRGGGASLAPESWTPIGEMFLSGRRSLHRKRAAPIPAESGHDQTQTQTAGTDNTADGLRSSKRLRRGQVDYRLMNTHGCRTAGAIAAGGNARN